MLLTLAKVYSEFTATSAKTFARVEFSTKLGTTLTPVPLSLDMML